jgi:hypothetical protein
MKKITTLCMLFVVLTTQAIVKIEGYLLNTPKSQIEVYEIKQNNTVQLVQTKTTLFSYYKIKLDENKKYSILFKHRNIYKKLDITTGSKVKIVIDVDFNTNDQAVINFEKGKYVYQIKKT